MWAIVICSHTRICLGRACMFRTFAIKDLLGAFVFRFLHCFIPLKKNLPPLGQLSKQLAQAAKQPTRGSPEVNLWSHATQICQP
ncbi:hypothetical protein L2E82_01461 [Cichorium intybus]|uniref:Uncharacterized protein n=1 Tax=Cichorium intybus TaxID=13427 RepID=A0ACB9H030_CICIN|nr:hypothetical protein L2E82_01461 [Cichorium intybus]